MSRIPLSDESDVELDDDIITDDVGTTGPEEQYADLNFNHEEDRRFELDPDDFHLYDDEDVYADEDWDDEFNDALGG